MGGLPPALTRRGAGYLLVRREKERRQRDFVWRSKPSAKRSNCYSSDRFRVTDEANPTVGSVVVAVATRCQSANLPLT
jgi:hypothetical protein